MKSSILGGGDAGAYEAGLKNRFTCASASVFGVSAARWRRNTNNFGLTAGSCSWFPSAYQGAAVGGVLFASTGPSARPRFRLTFTVRV